MEAHNLFAISRVSVTTEGKRYLAAVIGSTEYRNKYVKDLVKYKYNQLTISERLQKHNSKQLIQHLSVGLKEN